jgi:3-oxoacyl-[acyl-carrier protein] reductase
VPSGPGNVFDLNGQHAIITGGAQGIGLAVGHRLVSSGASVCLWDMNADELGLAKAELEAAHPGAEVTTEAVDVADEAGVEAAAKRGPADILVCSAGITGPNVALAAYPADAWRQVMEVNLTGTFLCNKALLRHMTAQKYGRVVNIASVAGKEGNPNASAYSASKAGVIALTKSAAKEVAGLDVAVNCVTPAAAKTRIFDQMSEEHIAFMLGKIPRARFLQVA